MVSLKLKVDYFCAGLQKWSLQSSVKFTILKEKKKQNQKIMKNL